MVLMMTAALFASMASSLIAGFFGSGGGMVAVPVLMTLQSMQHIPSELHMHIAVATTLAYSAIFMAVATYEQHKHKAVDWLSFKRLLFPTVVGALLGSVCAGFISGDLLKISFGAFLLVIAASFFRTGSGDDLFWDRDQIWFQIFSFFIAATVGLFGTGILTIPFLRKYGFSIKHSIAMSIALGVVTSAVGVVIYIAMGWRPTASIVSCFGYVNWELLIPFTIGSVLCARVGVKLAHKASPTLMHYLLCGFMVLIAIKMI